MLVLVNKNGIIISACYGGVKMKKLQIIGAVILIITIMVLILWKFTNSLPDCLVRVNGVLMMISIFITVFSTTKITKSKR